MDSQYEEISEEQEYGNPGCSRDDMNRKKMETNVGLQAHRQVISDRLTDEKREEDIDITITH